MGEGGKEGGRNDGVAGRQIRKAGSGEDKYDVGEACGEQRTRKYNKGKKGDEERERGEGKGRKMGKAGSEGRVNTTSVKHVENRTKNKEIKRGLKV